MDPITINDRAPLQNPTSIIARQAGTGNVSIRFTDFRDTPQPLLEEEDEEDRRPEERVHVALAGVHSWEPPREGKWDTLGQPSGKYDFLVDYSAPKEIPPWPTTCTGWGEEFDGKEEGEEQAELLYREEREEEEKQAELLYPVKRQDLVESWLEQLGEGTTKVQWGETSSEEEEDDDRSVASAKALVAEMDYPSRVAASIKTLEVLERAYPGASDIQSDQTSTFIPPNSNTEQVRYPPANTVIQEGGPSTVGPLEGTTTLPEKTLARLTPLSPGVRESHNFSTPSTT